MRSKNYSIFTLPTRLLSSWQDRILHWILDTDKCRSSRQMYGTTSFFARIVACVSVFSLGTKTAVPVPTSFGAIISHIASRTAKTIPIQRFATCTAKQGHFPCDRIDRYWIQFVLWWYEKVAVIRGDIRAKGMGFPFKEPKLV